MIKNLIVSAFADEYSPNFDTQLDMLSKNGVGYIEPRFIGEKNISDITCHEAKEIAKKLSYYGIGVSSIGSPLGSLANAPYCHRMGAASDRVPFSRS